MCKVFAGRFKGFSLIMYEKFIEISFEIICSRFVFKNNVIFIKQLNEKFIQLFQCLLSLS